MIILGCEMGVPPFKETPLPETNSKRKRPCKINILEDEFLNLANIGLFSGANC